ncbi:MAG: hypothetical protein HYY49_02600 [Ignavibacteriales bacterium]|nr:hypothetical protein [Ignavibacteriales bacterium]
MFRWHEIILLYGVLAIGCSSSSQFDAEVFPFLLADADTSIAGNLFRVYLYDLDADNLADLRIWYHVRRIDTAATRTVWVLSSRHPYRVDWYRFGYVLTRSEVDDDLLGQPSRVEYLENGRWNVKYFTNRQ